MQARIECRMSNIEDYEDLRKHKGQKKLDLLPYSYKICHMLDAEFNIRALCSTLIKLLFNI